MKKSFSVFVLFLMMLSLVLTAGAAWAVNGDIPGSNLKWDFTNGVLTISGKGDIPDYRNAMYESSPKPWFSAAGDYGIRSIVIEDGVTSIGTRAFINNWSLRSVKISNTVKSIGSHAFRNCSALKEITIPDSVESIMSNAFYRCYTLGKVTIGSGVTSIGSEAFEDCRGLSNFILKIPPYSSDGQELKFGNDVFYNTPTAILYYNGNSGWLTDSTGKMIGSGGQAKDLNNKTVKWKIFDVQNMSFKLTSDQTKYSIKPDEDVVFSVKVADQRGDEVPVKFEKVDSEYVTDTKYSDNNKTVTFTAKFPSEDVYAVKVKAGYESVSDYTTSLTFFFYVSEEDSFDISPRETFIESNPKTDKTVDFTLTTQNHDSDDIIWIAFTNDKFEYSHLDIVSTDTGAKLTASFDIEGSYIVNVLAFSSTDPHQAEAAVVSVDVKSRNRLTLKLSPEEKITVEEKIPAEIKVDIVYNGDQDGAVPQWDDVLWSERPDMFSVTSDEMSMTIQAMFNSAGTYYALVSAADSYGDYDYKLITFTVTKAKSEEEINFDLKPVKSVFNVEVNKEETAAVNVTYKGNSSGITPITWNVTWWNQPAACTVTSSDAAITIRASFSTEDTYTATVTATDRQGTSKSTKLQFVVQDPSDSHFTLEPSYKKFSSKAGVAEEVKVSVSSDKDVNVKWKIEWDDSIDDVNLLRASALNCTVTSDDKSMTIMDAFSEAGIYYAVITALSGVEEEYSLLEFEVTDEAVPPEEDETPEDISGVTSRNGSSNGCNAGFGALILSVLAGFGILARGKR